MDLSTLKSKCERLIPYANVHKYKLTPEAHKVFMEVVGLGTRVAGTDQYNEFHDITNKVFSKYKSDTKGTVAYQFTGCTGGKSGCHEDCAGAFPDKGYTEKSFCETHVGVYQDGDINIHYSPAKPCNVLLLHSKTPVKFDEGVSAKMREVGVRTVKVNIGGDITVHHIGDAAPKKSSKSKKNKTCDDDISLWSIIVFIVIIVVLLFVVYFAARWFGYGASNPESDYPKHDTKW